MRTNYFLFLMVFLFAAKMNMMGQTPFVIAKSSDPFITTHELTAGGVTLGISNLGGGYINKFDIPGYGNIIGPVSNWYGRAGTAAIRDHSRGNGAYNPTQGGYHDWAGTQCNISCAPGRLVTDKRPCALWMADGAYDFCEWENLFPDRYTADGTYSGYGSDLDGLDESNLLGKQATEITSEFDYYNTYEVITGTYGISIPCFYHYFEFEFARLPGHAMNQFGITNNGWVKDDISNVNPAGTHAGSDQDMNYASCEFGFRWDNALFNADYTHLIDMQGNWSLANRTPDEVKYRIHGMEDEIYPVLIVSNSTDRNVGPAIGVFSPSTDINRKSISGGSGANTYRDDRRDINYMGDETLDHGAPESRLHFIQRIDGILNRSRTPNNDPEKWTNEFFIMVGTPNEIYAACQALDANFTGGGTQYPSNNNCPGETILETPNVVVGWDFESGAQGWTKNPNNMSTSASDGKLICTMDGGGDPYVYNTTSPSFQTTNINYLDMKIENKTALGGGSIIVYTTTSTIEIPFQSGFHNGLDQIVRVDLSTVNGWSNNLTVTDVRVDPNQGGAGDISFEHIYFVQDYSSNLSTNALTVNSGIGDGSYTEGTNVTIVANAPAVGYTFDQWTGNVANVADVNAATTTITMPATNATVTATYVESSTGNGPNVVLGWDFETGNQGWTNNLNNMSVSASGGKLDCNVTGGDPYVWNTTSPTFSTSNINYLEVKVKNNTSATSGQIYIYAPSAIAIIVPMTPNSPDYETVVVDLSTVNGYNNSLSVTNMRLDPNTSGTNGLVSYEHIYWVQDYSNATTYTLTVNSGTGDGDYEDGTVVNLVADAPAVGYEFDQWTGDVSNVADVNAASTTITMPTTNVTLTATYKDEPISDWTVLLSEDFEGGFGNWNDGGTDCYLNTNATYSNSGSNSIGLQDNTSTSVMSTNALDLSAVSELKIDFSYICISMDNSNEDFWLQISTNGGSSFTTVEEWNRDDEFINGVMYNESVIITQAFSSNTVIRFRCDASGNADDVYIDDVIVSTKGGGTNPTYTLTVNEGSGSGDYTQGTVVGIVANAPAAGNVFDQWTGDVSNVANVNAASTNITMPAGNTTVTATYVAIPTGNLLTNGGFETPVVSTFQYGPFTNGWIFSSGSGVQRSGWSDEDAPEGAQTCFLQSVTSISQTFNIATSGNYETSFQIARRNTQIQPVEIYFDGILNATITPASSSFTEISSTSMINAGAHTLEFRSTVSGDQSSFIDNVYIGVPQSASKSAMVKAIESNKMQDDMDVKLYPNPANGNVTIETIAASKVQVFNIAGQIIHNNMKTAILHNLDVSTWKSGVYFVNVQCDGKVYYKRLIVE